MHVNPPRERPNASRLGLAADFLWFDPAPGVHIDGREDLRVDVSGWQVTGPGGVLVGAHHAGVSPDRPVRALARVGLTAQPVEQPFPGTIG